MLVSNNAASSAEDSNKKLGRIGGRVPPEGY